ncbi:hypothetical protein DFH29DRAFT_908870 [Suillus ampliporus]|nr:hypothetical protein DFH29DRAFT_908870 [Suillus ampliporus]
MSTATTTATITVTASTEDDNKGSVSTEATLQSLYNRAARAFLHRDVAVTFTLLNSAFALLPPPLAPSPDPLDVHRRKWDILRITLETTVFSSAPNLNTLPQPLRESLLSSPQSFISDSHARSLTLFTPSSLPRNPTSAFLPHQVLITLVASSLNVDCPNIGREITEDWLSKRGQYDFVPSTGEPYHKVLELYCLYVLPRLGEWKYAREFLSYENELSSDKRRELHLALEAQYVRAQESTRRTPPSPAPIPPPRSLSPTSSSSSLSTTSTRTIVPASPLPKLARQQSASSTSAVSDVTVTRSIRHRHDQSTPRGSPSASRAPTSRIPGFLSVDRSLITAQPPTPFALTRSYFGHYFTANKIASLSILFFLIPLLSLIIGRRRRAETPMAQVRRRLLEARGDSIARRLWNELVRAVLDTVRMGGGGLV